MITQKGFTLLELILVIIVVSSIGAWASRYYIDAMATMQRMSVTTKANHFSAAVTMLHSQWLINRIQPQKTSYIWHDKQLYLTSDGWPANSDKNLVPGASNQTVYECWQLWRAIFPNDTEVSMDTVSARETSQIHVSVHNSSVCRFEWSNTEINSHYIDYFLETGRVVPVIPEQA